MKDYVFQCVRGTLFDQATLTCQEASKVDCDASERLYPELAAGDSAFFFNRILAIELAFRNFRSLSRRVLCTCWF